MAQSRKYDSDLLKLLRKPSRELEVLSSHWNTEVKKIERERHRLRNKIKSETPDDPILSGIDLFSPIDSAANERLHTRALAYLLDWNKPHGFDMRILRSVLEAMPHGSGARKVLGLLNRKGKNIVVDPEFLYCDIWIEIRAGSQAALIIIENKVWAPEGKNQLLTYEKKADEWCKQNRRCKPERLLVYLTPTGKKPSSANWLQFSYLQMASALRKVWLENRKVSLEDQDAGGQQWLRFYIASITRGVLKIDPERLHVTPGDIKTYLGEGR
jgi:PD-(D/E)XK nuclease superfamily